MIKHDIMMTIKSFASVEW